MSGARNEQTRKAFPSYYALLWRMVVDEAKHHGYCVALHGSLGRDMDVLAAPWTHNAVPRQQFVHALCERLGLRGEVEHHNPAVRPHGRLAWALQLEGGAYIDLSVMPLELEENHPQEEVTGAD